MLIKPRVPVTPSSAYCRVSLEQGSKLGRLVAVIMQVSGTIVVILMAANVEAKIYERCDLAKKLEAAGLNGFNGYTIGDCETPVAPNPTHAVSCPPHSDPDPTPLLSVVSPG